MTEYLPLNRLYSPKVVLCEKPVSFEFEVTHFSPELPSLKALYDWSSNEKSLLPDAAVAPSSKAQSSNRANAKGQGYITDQDKKKAIEFRAMTIAREAYERESYVVTDTSASCPYDYYCEKPDSKLRVEVKGTSGSFGFVHVTKNEVNSARSHATDLFIVHNIHTHKTLDKWVASDGEVYRIKNWQPEEQHLTPTNYKYSVPV